MFLENRKHQKEGRAEETYYLKVTVMNMKRIARLRQRKLSVSYEHHSLNCRCSNKLSMAIRKVQPP